MPERTILIGVIPRPWLVLGAVCLGGAVFLALLVMLLVSSDDFGDPARAPSVPHGTCAPFCYKQENPDVPPAPPPPPQYPIPAR